MQAITGWWRPWHPFNKTFSGRWLMFRILFWFVLSCRKFAPWVTHSMRIVSMGVVSSLVTGLKFDMMGLSGLLCLYILGSKSNVHGVGESGISLWRLFLKGSIEKISCLWVHAWIRLSQKIENFTEPLHFWPHSPCIQVKPTKYLQKMVYEQKFVTLLATKNQELERS